MNAVDKKVRWVYKRGAAGDIEVWAESKEQAMNIMRQHGFIYIDPLLLFNFGNGIKVQG